MVMGVVVVGDLVGGQLNTTLQINGLRLIDAAACAESYNSVNITETSAGGLAGRSLWSHSWCCVRAGLFLSKKAVTGGDGVLSLDLGRLVQLNGRQLALDDSCVTVLAGQAVVVNDHAHRIGFILQGSTSGRR